jgi:hypothetical protein
MVRCVGGRGHGAREGVLAPPRVPGVRSLRDLLTMSERRTKSGLTLLTDVDCPACGGGAAHGLPITKCQLCNDRGVVRLPIATAWVLQQGKTDDRNHR